MSESTPKRGRPKKDPNAPKQRYNYSSAIKARKQTQRRLTEAKKRAAKVTKQAESKRRYARNLKKSFFPQVKEMFCTVAQQVGEKALHFSQTLLGIATIAIIVGFFLGVLWMS
jgi:hypothetical protein